jgi:hypothetical protein
MPIIREKQNREFALVDDPADVTVRVTVVERSDGTLYNAEQNAIAAGMLRELADKLDPR